MKASELIKKLEEKIEKFGDLDVYSICDGDYVHSVIMDEHWKTKNRDFILE